MLLMLEDSLQEGASGPTMRWLTLLGSGRSRTAGIAILSYDSSGCNECYRNASEWARMLYW